MGLWQYEQRTLQGSLCSIDFSDGSYHSRLWWPFVKLMSSLWKMAAHWKGAAVACEHGLALESSSRLTMLCLAGCAVAELAVERLAAAQLILDLAAVAVGCVLDIEVIELLVVHAVWGTLLPLGDASRRLPTALILVHSD